MRDDESAHFRAHLMTGREFDLRFARARVKKPLTRPLGGPMMPMQPNKTEESNMSPKVPLATVPVNADKSARAKAIEEAAKRKKEQPAPPAPAKPAAEKPAKKEKPSKPAPDPNLLSVSDVAKALGIDPKRARAKLRAAGQAAVEGRWPKVTRGSKEHDAMIILLSAEKDEPDEEEEEADEE